MSNEAEPKRAVDPRFYARLRGEVETWSRDGLISTNAADAILSKYVSVSPLYGRLIVTLATLGGILVGVGIILFIGSNWQAIPASIKIALLLISVGITYLSGYWLKYQRDFPRVGGALVFLGTLLFGGSIFLIGQRYHMQVGDPNLLTWWFVGVIPLAYITRSRTILTLALLAALGMVGYRATLWLESYYGNLEFFAWVGLYLVLGVLLYVLGTAHSDDQRFQLYARPYYALGVVLVFSALYLLTFKFLYEDVFYRLFETDPLPRIFMTRFNITAAIAFAGVVVAFGVTIRKKGISLYRVPYDLVGALFLIAIGYFIVLLPLDGAVLNTIAFNLIFFGGLIGLIFAGYLRGYTLVVNLALFFFGLGVISRYFDFAWELLARSLFFMLGGLVLLGTGVGLEQFRRRIFRRLRAIEVTDVQAA